MARMLRRPKHCPDTRAIGSTFEFTFIFPKPANSGNTRPQMHKAAKPSRKALTAIAQRKTPAHVARPRLAENQWQEPSE